MLRFNDVSFGYKRREALLFSHLDWQLETGGICGLLGPNGCGKTTLLYLMTGLLLPKDGSVEADGRDVSQRRREVLSEMFIVPETFELPSETLCAYINIYRPFYPCFSDEILQHCLSEFDLPLDSPLDRLSMGQQKKVMIAFALACGTRYLFLDEPTNGLDVTSKKLFRKVMAANIAEDRTAVIATHQISDVAPLLDGVTVLGRNDAQSTSEVLCSSSLAAITRRLSFTAETYPPKISDKRLYTERTPFGYASLSLRRDEEEETPVNLELLYNALQQGVRIPDLS